jgi:hypothetical protein
MNPASVNSLCDIVWETCFAIHSCHRHGHVEKIDENASADRVQKKGIDVKPWYPVDAYDVARLRRPFDREPAHRGAEAAKTIADEHVAQLLGYLKSGRIETGLLINFGAPQLYVKKYLMSV